jgi:hypothetical protein
MYNIIGLPEYFKRETTHRKVSTAFLSTEAYEQALSDNTPILYIEGNKGTGKSTILNKILQDNSTNVLFFFFKEKFQKIESGAKKVLEEKPSSQPYLTYEIEWKNELWNEIVLHLYNNYLKERGIIPIDKDEYLNLFNFIRERHLPIDLPITSKAFLALRKIRKVVFPGGSGGEIDPTSNLDYTGANGIDLVKEDVAKILIEKPLFLMIDEIDKIDIWDADVHYCIKGLIEAIDSVHREVHSYDTEKFNLLLRIAIRGDMLHAASDYVDEVKINSIGIDKAWTEANLEELAAQQIRQHWNLNSREISREKLLTEIFPPYLFTDNQRPFKYFHLLSGGNPRFLFAFLKSGLDYAIQRANNIKTSSSIGPVHVLPSDIASILKTYSVKSLSEQISGRKFLLPGLEYIKSFIKNKKDFVKKSKSISHEKFFDSLFHYIKNDKELHEKIKKWPRVDTPIEEKVPQAIYELGLIAYKNDTHLFYYPSEKPQDGTIIVHPWFEYALLSQEFSIVSESSSIEELKTARDNLISAVDRMRALILSTSQTIIKVDNDESALEDESYLKGNNILYGIAFLLWASRNLSKRIAAFADQVPSDIRDQVIIFLKVIDDTFENMSKALNTEVENLHILAILLNSSSDQFNITQEVFEKDSLLPENKNVFVESTKNISDWIKALDGNMHDSLTLEIDDILNTISSQLTQIILEPIAEVE